MKKRILSVTLLLAVLCASVYAASLAGTRQLTKTNSSTSVPVALAPAGTYFRKATIIGKKAARTANTGTVYIGPSSTNDDQPFEITTGSVIEIVASEGTYLDLNQYYLDVATANDGVVVIYEF